MSFSGGSPFDRLRVSGKEIAHGEQGKCPVVT